MNWLNKQTWKDCFVSTFLCLAGCSIGAMVILFYLVNYNWFFVFTASFLTGLATSIIFLTLWKIIFKKVNFNEAIKSSFKMSIVSMTIIILAENLIMYLTYSRHSANGMQGNYSDKLLPMFMAMSVGFLLALPYNYYILTKTGKTCH